MKKLTNKERQKQLDVLAAMPDSAIDTSEIPELTLGQLRGGIRGQMYRPVKRPVTMRLDADVIAWLKQDGRGYQTKANSLLRKEMLRALQQTEKSRKRAKGRESVSRRTSAARHVA